jgi:hypothetical protein
MTLPEPEPSVSRRTLLRRAAVTGGAAVAATAAATAATAAPASATSGGPLLLSEDNQASGETAIWAGGPGATLVLRNDHEGPQLRLEPQPVTDPDWASIHSTTAGLAHVVRAPDGGVRSAEVLTTANATMLVPIRPTRVLDTRTAAGRSRLIGGASKIDAAGRAGAGSWLLIDLDGIVEHGDGLLGNITVADTQRAGFATVYGRGSTEPAASTINWWAAGQILSNGVITQIGPYENGTGSWSDTVAIWVTSPAVVILDVTGLLVFHPQSAVINNPKGLTAGSEASAVRAEVIRASARRAPLEVRAGA